jgi:hypothetical protein
MLLHAHLIDLHGIACHGVHLMRVGPIIFVSLQPSLRSDGRDIQQLVPKSTTYGP